MVYFTRPVKIVNSGGGYAETQNTETSKKKNTTSITHSIIQPSRSRIVNTTTSKSIKEPITSKNTKLYSATNEKTGSGTTGSGSGSGYSTVIFNFGVMQVPCQDCESQAVPVKGISVSGQWGDGLFFSGKTNSSGNVSFRHTVSIGTMATVEVSVNPNNSYGLESATFSGSVLADKPLVTGSKTFYLVSELSSSPDNIVSSNENNVGLIIRSVNTSNQPVPNAVVDGVFGYNSYFNTKTGTNGELVIYYTADAGQTVTAGFTVNGASQGYNEVTDSVSIIAPPAGKKTLKTVTAVLKKIQTPATNKPAGSSGTSALDFVILGLAVFFLFFAIGLYLLRKR